MPSTLVLENEDAVYTYCRSFLSKTSATQLSRSIVHMVHHHGLEFTVDYLKGMKLKFRDSYSTTNGLAYKPKNSWKPIWKLSLEQGLRLLNIYTCVRLREISPNQGRKFVSSVVTPETDEKPKYIDPCVAVRGNRLFRLLEWKHPYNWIRSPGKRAPHCVAPGKVITQDENTLSFDDCMSDIFKLDNGTKKLVSEYAQMYAKATWVPTYTIRGYLAGPKRSFLDAYKDDVSWDTESGMPLVGKLGFIQEKGAKLRSVANAFRFHQMVLTPLGDWLLGILQGLPWDCTFNQDRGYDFVKESLSTGNTVYAFDLSNATDKFPLSYQKYVLENLIEKIAEPNGRSVEVEKESLVTKQDLTNLSEIFCRISRGEWLSEPLSKFNSNRKTIRWTQGQPLGLYPSFALFALSHGNLLREIEYSLGVEDTFRVLGDDVVINHPEVARSYYKRMSDMGCSISLSKSIVSSRISEFAGKIITADRVLDTPKWCNFSMSDPFGPIRSLGLDGFKFIKPSLISKMKLYASLPEPVGMGFNPSGLSLDERMILSSLPWFFKAQYEPITDIDLSYEDRKARIEAVLHREGSAIPNATKFRVIDVPRDQRATNVNKLEIDHYNSVIRSLLPWESIPPKVGIPDVMVRLPERSKPNVKRIDRNVLSRVYKYYREHKKRQTV